MLKNPSKNWDLKGEIETLQKTSLYRRMPEVRGIPGRNINVEGREVLNFSSNNYLGLACHPRIIDSFSQAAKTYGVGSTASRLIAGNSPSHRKLEQFIAKWKNTEAALVFGSGYQANLSILTSLTDKNDLIVSDELNHASIIDGCRLSRGKTLVYRHCDPSSAFEALRKSGFRRKLLVTESIFSMDGDQAPLRELSDLCQSSDTFMVVDEAHATGIYGPSGAGLCAEMDVVPDVQMGTLGKAVGVSGAYVAGSRYLIDLLVNKARPFIFTTAHSPALSAATMEALKIIISPEGDLRRIRLKKNVELMNRLLENILPPREFACQILPIVIGPSDLTMKISRACLEEGLFVQGIRFPSVPAGAARLRLTLMSDHTPQDIQRASEVIGHFVC
ncbi:MAG: aminotransferase class I/II-fold pyridoxal phosphate-dependent enzyme [Desulfomonilaceae bacterium]